ncbi:hypothetical protein FB567DRAFT_277507 [Paraphoma chrysanthemicola]|uniref:BTB domain-containing protein n=1 Tax=Paraphoma chrysanthemicola TaxID=798071 RepID=A0A8K0W1G1_9PLEO|nr:hypothetical protein FB567DRAFT_277507 [Paraphoma chrysanthemicola]
MSHDVHPAIICPRSHLLSDMIRSTPTGNVITLPDDTNPELITLLIQYCYEADYEPYYVAKSRSDLDDQRTPKLLKVYNKEMETHVKMFTLGHKHNVDGLQELVTAKFRQACQKFWYRLEFEEVAHEIVIRPGDELSLLRDVIVDTVATHGNLEERERESVSCCSPSGARGRIFTGKCRRDEVRSFAHL